MSPDFSVFSAQHRKKSLDAKRAFTLIELSIVLVVIGLIIGGVLTGQDLIKAAEQRATLAQIERYNTAINTFVGKYGGLPGDLPQATAGSFGLFQLTKSNNTGQGDGNGLIEGGANNIVAFIGETPAFFCHLSQTNLIDGSYGGGTTCSNITASSGAIASGSASTLPTYIPLAKLGRGNYITVGADDSDNYYIIGELSSITTFNGWYNTGTDNLVPSEAYNMDKKIDDGLPGSGSIWAMSVQNFALNYVLLKTPWPTSAAGGSGACVNSTPTPNTYALTGTSPKCAVRIQFN